LPTTSALFHADSPAESSVIEQVGLMIVEILDIGLQTIIGQV